MCLHPQSIGEIPEETATVARASFPKGNVYMKMRDELGVFFTDEDFAQLFPARGQAAESPWRLALIAILQFAENLTDRQAADAVRGRIDWKYALGLALTDPGFHFSILTEFRERLLAGGTEQLLLDRLLTRFQDLGLLKAGGRQRTESSHVVAAVRELSRLECAGEALRQVWIQLYYQQDGQTRWREKDNRPPAARQISSPYDPDARYASKRETDWTGYKVFLTETCDADAPHLITHVETTQATVQDIEVVEDVHIALAEKGLLPREHIVDTAFVSSDVLVTSDDLYAIDLVGPVRPDTSWQAQAAQGFDISHFTIDWESQTVTCPNGKTSYRWQPGNGKHGKPNIRVSFHSQDCSVCPVRSQCTQSTARGLTFPRQAEQIALQTARARQETEAFQDLYSIRAGIEGTISEAMNPHDLRRSRYRGIVKTHLQHVATAAAMNLARIIDWLTEGPRPNVRISPFAALAA